MCINQPISRHFYRSTKALLSILQMLFLPLNLESFAYRLLVIIPVLLQCKSNENENKV